MAIQTIYDDKTSLTGGSATALDGIDGNSLLDGDRAYVLIPGTLTFYVYRLNATSAAAESSPDIIAPDTNPGDKRWILFSVMAAATFASATIGTIYGSAAANGDLILSGTSHATKTTSLIELQPSGGNVCIGGAIDAGTSGNKVSVVAEGTAPTTSPADVSQIWSANYNGAGTNRFYMRDEAGNSGPIAFLEPKSNLLSNTEWKAASTSTVCEVTSGAAPVLDGADAALVNNLLVKGGFDDQASVDTWTEAADAVATSAAGGKTGNCLTITGGASANPYVYKTFTTVSGKLYQFNGYVNDGIEATYAVKVGSSGADSSEYYSATGEAANDWTTTVLNKVFEATGASTTVTLKQTAAGGAGTTLLFDSITLYEVTPGWIAANALGPDGWEKYTYVNLFRQHNDATYTKDGSFYSLKTITSSAGQFVQSPPAAIASSSSFYKKFAGKQVCLGAWVLASDANHANISFYDTADRPSAFHTGSGLWEWIEFSITVAAATTNFSVYLKQAVSGKTAYFSQPVLVFGSSIGQGNYAPKPSELINLDTRVLLYAGVVPTATGTRNLEALSSGKIGKGVKKIFGYHKGQNTAVGQYISCQNEASKAVGNQLYSQVANVVIAGSVDTGCDGNGDFYQVVSDANWSGYEIGINGVQL